MHFGAQSITGIQWTSCLPLQSRHARMNPSCGDFLACKPCTAMARFVMKHLERLLCLLALFERGYWPSKEYFRGVDLLLARLRSSPRLAICKLYSVIGAKYRMPSLIDPANMYCRTDFLEYKSYCLIRYFSLTALAAAVAQGFHGLVARIPLRTSGRPSSLTSSTSSCRTPNLSTR
jgi:hypothetical protein